METEKKEPSPEEEDKKQFLLPGWVRDVGMKILPWIIMGVVGASIGLYTDNIGMKRDVAREAWRNDQQDSRDNRFEANQDRINSKIDQMRDDQEEFKALLIQRLDVLIEKRTRRER